MSENEVRTAVHRAIAKRDRIIQREGDSDGERLAPRYLEMLIEEELEQATAIRRFNGGRLQHFEGAG